MPETCENVLGLVHSWIHNASQTSEIYQVQPYSVNFKAPGSFEIHWARQHIESLVLFRT